MCWLAFLVQYVKICSDQQALCFHTRYECMQEWVQISLTVVLFASANCVLGTKKYGTAASFYILSESVPCKWYQWTLHNPGNWNIVKPISANYKIAYGLNSDTLCERQPLHRPGTSTANFIAKSLIHLCESQQYKNGHLLLQWTFGTTYDACNKIVPQQIMLCTAWCNSALSTAQWTVIYNLQNFKVFNFSKLDF